MITINYLNGQKGKLQVQSTVMPEPIPFNEWVRIIRENNIKLKKLK